MLHASDESVRIETRATEVQNVPLDSDGSCDKDEAEELAEDTPCTTYNVLSGQFIAELPKEDAEQRD